jgi:hypothetical protein
MKLQNTFSKGTVNSDINPRFLDSSELIDAENFFVTTVDGASGGIGKNALGNALKTAYNITGAKTVGNGIDASGNKVYNCIKGTFHDYIIEYDANTHASAIVLQSTTGTRLNFISGERIRNVDINVSGIPYDSVTQQGGNLMMFSGDSNPPRIINIERAKTWGVDGFSAEEIMLIKSPPLYPPLVEQVNTLDSKENYMEDKFISFSYRYKYKDGYHSPFSPWQSYSFTPGKFDLDFASFENKGMLNVFNACNISFNTGPREVAGVDLLFKESNSDIVYCIDKYNKIDEGWSVTEAETKTIQFSNSKVYSIIPTDQYYRSMDYVPENTIAQTTAGNRAIFANYKDGKNLIDKNGDKVVIDYSVGFTPTSNQSITATKTTLSGVSPYDSSAIVDGKVRIDFTGATLVKGAGVGIYFDLKSISNPTSVFKNTYYAILPNDYANIQLVVNDSLNGFKSGILGYFSDLFKSGITPTPYNFVGFNVSVIGTNVIEITLPTMRYETIVLPSGPNTYTNEYYKDNNTTSGVESVGVKGSMRSFRSYEICQIYKDAQGRKTTALTSSNNTVFVPLGNSITQNKLKVTIPSTQKPPEWATTYKFGLKENKGSYEEIYASIFYVDGVYRWVRLDGTNKNKVQEGDTLLVKKDILNVLSVPTYIKVLEVKLQEKDFITGNLDGLGAPILETAGLYMKFKPGNFSIDYSPEDFKNFDLHAGTAYGTPYLTFDIPNAIPEGSVISFDLHSDYHRDSEYNDYKSEFMANSSYANFKAFYDAQLAGVAFIGTGTGSTFPKVMNSTTQLKITGTSSGVASYWDTRKGFLDAKITIRTVSGYFIFETIGKETKNDIFYETPDVFTIVDGEHQYEHHILDRTFNCYVQGNGAESHQIRDAFNEKYISVDFSPTAVGIDEYKQVNRPVDITYSGVYNPGTNVNKLNEFNLSLANFKDDIDKSYGAIYKIKGKETNLQVYQESKDSQVFYGKDILLNADGSSNLSQISDVLGSQDLYEGEFGISTHSDSYDSYANDSYHTDVNRGVVIKKSNNGLFEISSQGMNNYFKTLFRDNVINHVNGTYDQFNGVYVLNIQYNTSSYVTWVYSDKDNGWLGRISFNPEDMCCINGKFLSFFEGEIYEHNQLTGRNTFFGVEYPSKFTFNFSQNPSERKIYKTAEIEGTDAWQLALETDADKGYINSTDFEKQEGVYRAYTRISNEAIDSSLLSCQGIGNCTISGLVLSFGFTLDDVISIGDEIRNSNLLLVGTILSKTPNSLTLNSVANISSGDFVLCSKPQSAESGGMLGYHMVVTATLSKNTKAEVYAVNSEVIKSFV